MTYKKMVEKFNDCWDWSYDGCKDKIYHHDIGAWKGKKWIANFVTVNKTVEDFKKWVWDNGYDMLDFYFMGNY